jgi:predicted TPR repeat methyltransferase
VSAAAKDDERVTAERFERLYAESPDPWGYCEREYERAKYAATLAALGSRRYERALEVGCSIGVFTRALADRCDSLVAVDFSARALSLARERLAGLANVHLAQASFPERLPDGTWDLIICSEVLYYLDRATLEIGVSWLTEQLELGATVLAVSWRGPGETEPLRGEEVHDLLARRLTRWHALDGRAPGYRLDRFDGA